MIKVTATSVKKLVLDCQKAIYCSICCTWMHFKCTTIDSDEYSRILCSRDNWYCSSCLAGIFPFNHIEDDIAFVDCLYCNSRVKSVNHKMSVLYEIRPSLKLAAGLL